MHIKYLYFPHLPAYPQLPLIMINQPPLQSVIWALVTNTSELIVMYKHTYDFMSMKTYIEPYILHLVHSKLHCDKYACRIKHDV